MYFEYDEDDERYTLHSKFVNPLQAWYYKFQKYYKRTFYCFECDNSFEALVKKRQKSAECPICEN